MNETQKRLVIDCERMKYPHTGLYQFCLHISQALLATNNGKPLCFYTPPSAGKVFGNAVCYRWQKPLHKIFFPPLRNTALWHCTHQDSDYFPFSRNAKKVLTVHDLNYLHDESKSPEKQKRFRDDLQRKIDEADFVAFISRYSFNDTNANFHLGSKPTAIVYNGCTIHELPALRPPAYIPPKPFLFTLGTVTPKKNFHVLPALLCGNDFLLVIAGLPQNKAYKEKIMDEAKRLGVADRVVFTGPVFDNDKQWYLKNCTAFAFPSLAEGFGLPVIEAMYFGKPVILSQATSLPEIGGNLATYFPSFEPGEMQQTLVNCLKDFEANPYKATALKERALSFSWQDAARAYHRIYEGLL